MQGGFSPRRHMTSCRENHNVIQYFAVNCIFPHYFLTILYMIKIVWQKENYLIHYNHYEQLQKIICIYSTSL